MEYARLTRYGSLSVTGADARAFLHAQLTNDIQNLPPSQAALAGWCSAKGRLLASLLVVPTSEGFLLQLARDLVPAVAKRLSMFILRSKVSIADQSEGCLQFGVWGELPQVDVPRRPFAVLQGEGLTAIRMAEGRLLVMAADSGFAGGSTPIPESRWTLDEIRAGRPYISSATQDEFVPQMVNFDTLGAVNFQKGCYPGQEIVARAQYRGQVKRRMKLFTVPPGVRLQPGAEFAGGKVVDAAPTEAGSEILAVVPVDAA